MTPRQIARLTFASALLGLTLTACSGSEERKAAYLEHGKQLFAEGNYVKAQLELKNALQIDPKIAEAHFLLGRIAEQKQDWRAAFGQFKSAVDLNPTYSAAQIKLGRLYLLSGDADQAMAMADAVIKVDANDVDGLLLKALVLGRRHEDQQAIDIVKRILDNTPENAEAAITLATLYTRADKKDDAARVLSAAIKVKSDEPRLYLALAQLKLSKDPGESERLIKKVIELEPDNYANRVRLSGFYIQQNRLDDAEQLLRNGVAAKPEDFSRTLLLADFLAQKRSLDAAEAVLTDAVNAKADDRARRFALAKFYASTRQSDKAEAVYKEVLKNVEEGPDWVLANNSLAEILLAKRDLNGSSELIGRVLKENPKDSGALLLRGRVAMLRQDPEAAIVDFRQVLHDDPNATAVLKLLAEAQLANHQPELANDNIDRVIEATPNDLSARIAKIKLLMVTKDLPGALKASNEALGLSPGNPSVLDLQIQVLAEQKNWSGAVEAARQLQKSTPNEPAGHLHLGRIYALQEKGDAAVGEFEKAVALAPENADLWAVLVRADVALKHTDKAIGRMRTLIKKNAKHPFAHELLAELYESKNQTSKAEGEYVKAAEANPNWSIPVVKLAELYQRKGEVDKAIALYKRVNATHENLGLLVKLAELYVANQRTEDALALYRDVLNRHPDADVIANNLASTLMGGMSNLDAKDIDEAYTLAKRFENSDNPFYLDTLAWALYQKGDYKAALPLLEKSVAKAERFAVLQYHLGMTHYRLGDKAAAKQALEKAVAEGIADYPGIDEARAVLAKL